MRHDRNSARAMVIFKIMIKFITMEVQGRGYTTPVFEMMSMHCRINKHSIMGDDTKKGKMLHDEDQNLGW